jgi:TonB family protein
MTRILFVLALGGVALGQQTDYKAGQPGPFCGVVTSHQLQPVLNGGCDLRLTLKAPGAAVPLDIFIPDGVRKQLPVRGADYYNQEICVSGAVSPDSRAPTVKVDAPSQIEVKSKRGIPSFGSEAADTCEAGIRPPRILKETRPTYTAEVMRQKIEGVVVMDVVVGADGKVAAARVTRSLDPELDEQALQALKQWQFEPGTRDGKAVKVMVTVEMTFSLRDRPID